MSHSNVLVYSKTECRIAELYLRLLPFRMISQFSGALSVLKGASLYFDFLLHILGLLLFVNTTKGRLVFGNGDSSIILKRFFQLIVFLNLSSVIMALVIQMIYGDYAGETAFSGITGMLVYFTQYAFIFLYNSRVFKLLSKEKIEKIISDTIWLLMVIGYIQIVVMTIGGSINTIYKGIDFLGVFPDVNRVQKLSLTTTEGAGAGTLISIFVTPYLFSAILFKNKIGKYVIQLILWVPIVVFTRSSTAYILFAFSLLIFTIKLMKTHRGSNAILFLVITMSFILLVLLLFPEILSTLFPDLYYMLFKKATDLSNSSTASRTVPFIMNWGAFTEAPIFGVGNGLQGYFYTKYFPSWGFNVAGSDILQYYDKAQTTIVNGGVFIPSLLSGYGVVGVTLIVLWVKKYLLFAKKNREELGIYYHMFVFAAISFIISGLQGEVCGTYYMWFMLSLPLMASGIKKSENVDETRFIGEKK